VAGNHADHDCVWADMCPHRRTEGRHKRWWSAHVLRQSLHDGVSVRGIAVSERPRPEA
jgi:hypothetical protein